MTEGQFFGKCRVVLKKLIGHTPACGAVVQVTRGKTIVASAYADGSGEVEITLPAPPIINSQIPNPPSLPYNVYDVQAFLGGHIPVLFKDVLIFPGIVTICRHVFVRTPDMPKKRLFAITVTPHKLSAGLTVPKSEGAFCRGCEKIDNPVVPQSITVRIGLPQGDGENVTIGFIDYIKAVSSCELFPTWPVSCLMAGIISIVSAALNRLSTRHYRKAGYDFDITSLDQYDRQFIKNVPTYENIDNLVYSLFDKYVAKKDENSPVLTFSHEGYISGGEGLSLWGSVELARQQCTPYDILNYYFGDIRIENAAVEETVPGSYDKELFLTSQGEKVHVLQYRLNKIALSREGMPFVNITGLYDIDTAKAVEEFQRLYGNKPTGITDYATWHKVHYIYNAQKAENAGIEWQEGEGYPGYPLSLGCRDLAVVNLTKHLSEISKSLGKDIILPVKVGGEFDERVQRAVLDFQNYTGLEMTGVVDQKTWDAIVRTGFDIQKESSIELAYPGKPIRYGDKGRLVEFIQQALNKVGICRTEIPLLDTDGVFGNKTRNAVIAFQKHYALSPDGIVGPLTWARMVAEYTGICEYEGK